MMDLNKLTPSHLMDLALTKYLQLKQEGVWRAKSKQDEQYIALMARLNEQNQTQPILIACFDPWHWLASQPARGSYRTQLHVLAGGQEQERMQFKTMQDLENLFAGDHQDIHRLSMTPLATQLVTTTSSVAMIALEEAMAAAGEQQ